MAEEYSRTPSGIARGASNPSSFQAVDSGPRKAEMGPIVWVILLVSLLLSSAAFYNSLFGGRLSASEKSQLRGIAEQLREIQQKDITMTSPLKTTAYVDEAIPISEIFPKNFALPINADIRIDQEVNAQSTSGQIVPLRINATIPIRTSVGLDPAKESTTKILIKKEIPIDTQFSATLRVQALYGKELNSIIDTLEKMSQ